MKKNIVLIVLAMSLVTVWSIQIYAATESNWSGFHRTRGIIEGDWTGDDSEGMDRTLVDTRSQLQLEAKLNDQLSVFTQFRVDAEWGDYNKYARIQSNSKDLGVLRSYVDCKLGAVNLSIGVQELFLARGIMLNDNGPAVKIDYSLTDQLSLGFQWIKVIEGGYGDKKNQDIDYYIINPTLKPSDKLSISPFLLYARSDEINTYAQKFDADGDGIVVDDEAFSSSWLRELSNPLFDKLDMVYLGVDVDITLGMASLWFTGIYEWGSVDLKQPILKKDSVDISGFAFATGGTIDLGQISLYGQIFYGSGDDINDNDIDINSFIPTEGGYYYWSEIMGLGNNDWQTVNNMHWSLSNVIGGGVGATIKAMPKLTLDGSIWYAAAVEDFIGARSGNKVDADMYGTEINCIATYDVLDNLSLTLIGAYVFAGDGITEGVKNDQNPYTIISQLKVDF